MSIISLLVLVIVMAIIYWALHQIIGAFSLGPPISTLIIVVYVVLCALYLLQFVSGVNTGIRLTP